MIQIYRAVPMNFFLWARRKRPWQSLMKAPSLLKFKRVKRMKLRLPVIFCRWAASSSQFLRISQPSSFIRLVTRQSSSQPAPSPFKRRIPVWARVLIIIFAILFAAVAIIGGTYLGLREKGQNDLVVEQANPKYEETVEYNGHTYIYDKTRLPLLL